MDGEGDPLTNAIESCINAQNVIDFSAQNLEGKHRIVKPILVSINDVLIALLVI